MESLYEDIRLPEAPSEALESELEGEATLPERTAHTEKLVGMALRLVENCQEAYGEASPETKKLFDQAFFKRLVVQQKKIAQVHYEAPFDTLLTDGFVSDAWRRRTGIEPARGLSPPRRF